MDPREGTVPNGFPATMVRTGWGFIPSFGSRGTTAQADASGASGASGCEAQQQELTRLATDYTCQGLASPHQFTVEVGAGHLLAPSVEYRTVFPIFHHIFP